MPRDSCPPRRPPQEGRPHGRKVPFVGLRPSADPAPPAPPPLGVTVRAAWVLFGGAPLFDRLDFTLDGGRTTCLLGTSGVGKSTLLRLIAGLEPGGPQTRILGSDGKPLAGRIAYMAQQDMLLPWLTVLDNVLLGARLRRERVDAARRERAAHLLERVGLGARRGARPAELSGGMRQRAALARTLMEDRPVVLMDEPFSSLDALTRARLQDLAAGLLAGRTVLLVTHDPLEALRLGHKIHIMAGFPATIDQPLVPPGTPARAVDDPRILGLQGELLRRLAGTGAEAGAGVPAQSMRPAGP